MAARAYTHAIYVAACLTCIVWIQKPTENSKNMRKPAFFLATFIGFFWPVQMVCAQIFGGVSETGSVYLSNFASNEGSTVIVKAATTSLAYAGAATTTKSIRSGLTVPSAEVFDPYIAEAGAASKLPVELIHAVIKTESNYNPWANSPKGAQGLMQLMPATAKRFGGINALDPRDNILTGSRYLRWLLDYFNQDMELAVAGYNAGEGAVVKAGHKIPPYAETQKYVPKVLLHYKQAAGLGLIAFKQQGVVHYE